MVDYYIDQEDVLTDFFRTYMTDPRGRIENDGNYLTVSNTNQKEFPVPPVSGSISCITGVAVNSINKVKWVDYFWDYQNSKIVFYEGQTLGHPVNILYKYGSTNWIYSDRPDEDLSATSFPRISLFTVGGSGNKIGNYQAKTDSRPVIQIDCWARNGQVFTIDDKKYSNEYLGRYLGNKLIQVLQDNEEQLHGIFFDYDIVSTPRGAGYSEEYMAHHTVVEIRVKGLNLGRIQK